MTKTTDLAKNGVEVEPSDELSYDEAEAIGLDGTGRDMDPRFPYRESTLTPAEASLLANYRAHERDIC